jgi:hypothetical protein
MPVRVIRPVRRHMSDALPSMTTGSVRITQSA